MFKKLHIQLTLFCSAVTSLIMVAMSVVCLSVAESDIRNSFYQSFINNSYSMMYNLESQAYISHAWILEMEHNYDCYLDIRDNGEELYSQAQNSSKEKTSLIRQAESIAANQYNLDITSPNSAVILSKHIDFKMRGEDGQSYYVFAAIIPKQGGTLGLASITSLNAQDQQIFRFRLLFFLVDLGAIILLTVFSYFFTKKMLHPIHENQKRQIQFIASASHELRSPLTVMLSTLSAIRLINQNQADKYLDTMEQEGHRMTRLIQDMLTLASADNQTWSIHLDKIELDTLLLQTYEKYEPIAKEKGHQLLVDLPEEPLDPCQCDGERIAQVLAILINNAFSYTPPGGIIRLRLISLPGKAQLQVIDNGPGVSEDQKNNIFERFYRSDKSHKSKEHFGLGLCIAKEIVKLHRGKITISDTPGGGATFTVTLPLRSLRPADI